MKEFNRSKKRNTRSYCSPSCFKESTTRSSLVVCEECGVTFRKQANQLQRSDKSFCSRKCSITNSNRKRKVENHPNWNGPSVRNYRKYALSKTGDEGAKCAFCDYSNEDVLQVHHKDGNRENNELDNLAIICPTHHVEVHLGLRCFETVSNGTIEA